MSSGTLAQIRTETKLLLRERPLPIGLQGQIIECQKSVDEHVHLLTYQMDAFLQKIHCL